MTSHLSTSELARRCEEETGKFHRQLASDTAYCFELLRRALAELKPDAFGKVYAIYGPQVRKWVASFPGFRFTDESVEFFANIAWHQWYQHLRGTKFAGFSNLRGVLSYLKDCVATAILEYREKQRLELEYLGEELPEPEAGQRTDSTALSNVVAHEIWERICVLLVDDQDRLLAYSVFVQDLKNAQIIARHPGLWRDERAIAVAMQRIRRLLRGDPQLRKLLDMQEPPADVDR